MLLYSASIPLESVAIYVSPASNSIVVASKLGLAALLLICEFIVFFKATY